MSSETEKKVYEDTLELFDYKCAICGNNQVQLHHIIFGSLHGTRKSLTYMGNVIPLCKKHHDMVHTNKKKYMPMLIEIINEKMKRG